MSGCSSSTAPAAGAPVPSRVRLVQIYPAGRAPNMGLVGPNAILQWTPKHPLDGDWWWVGATAWCRDIDDIIGQIAWQLVGGDGALSVTDQTISTDGMFGGLFLRNGTPGQLYTLRIRLTGLSSGSQISRDILLPVESTAPILPLDPTQATISGDGVSIAGIPLYVSEP